MYSMAQGLAQWWCGDWKTFTGHLPKARIPPICCDRDNIEAKKNFTGDRRASVMMTVGLMYQNSSLAHPWFLPTHVCRHVGKKSKWLYLSESTVFRNRMNLL